jgi:hypothetical protein
MAENPLKKSDRILQKKTEVNDVKQSVTLFDVDYAMMSYLEDVVLPTLDINGQAVKVPVIYGNSERWNGARRQGVYRDTHGKIQLPIMMIRRTTIAKNDAMPMLNRHVSYQAIKKWSKDNRYDKFGLMKKQVPKYEVYNITMPDYVEINYECMAWTSYTEHLNTIIESLTWASDEYWGDKKKFKFNTTITDYNVVNEVGEGTERINRVEFTLNVRAYLLPEKFDGQNTTKKGFTNKRIVFSTEIDLTADGRLESILTNPSEYNANKDVLDYLEMNGSYSIAATTNGQTVFTINSIKLVSAPSTISATITPTLTINSIGYEVNVYKNVTKLTQGVNFTATYVGNVLVLTFISGTTYDTTDVLNVTGKFITL